MLHRVGRYAPILAECDQYQDFIHKITLFLFYLMNFKTTEQYNNLTLKVGINIFVMTIKNIQVLFSGMPLLDL